MTDSTTHFDCVVIILLNIILVNNKIKPYLFAIRGF